MAIKLSDRIIQKRKQFEKRRIYRALGLDKNGHLKKTAAQRKLEKLLGPSFFERTRE